MASGDPDLYRILCVQPDAPSAVLRSSFRTLMLELRAHPDHGGDHAAAAQLNEAWAVLSDPDRRAAYDAARAARLGHAGAPAGDDHEAPDGPDAAPVTAPARPPRRGLDGGACAFCGTEPPPGLAIRPETSCVDCRSPLARAGTPELVASGRRAAHRVARESALVWFDRWPQPAPHRARALDLSPGGIRLETTTAAPVHRAVKLSGSLLDAVGRVASCRARPGGAHELGIEFVTVRFLHDRGSFLSTSA